MKFFCLILLLVSTLTYSQSIDLKNWVENKKTIDRYKHPQNEISYIIIKDSVNYRIVKQTSAKKIVDSIPFSDEFIDSKIGKNYGRRIVKKVFNGYLISYAHGEFGGNLYFVSDDNKKSYLIAERHRIKFFVEFSNDLFAFGGLSHLGTSRGSAYKLNYKREWKLEYIKNLQADPINIIQNKNKIYIVSYENLLQFKPNNELKTVFTFPFNVGIFYPTSSVIIKNDLYIAMRSGILRIANFENKPTFHWYEEKE